MRAAQPYELPHNVQAAVDDLSLGLCKAVAHEMKRIGHKHNLTTKQTLRVIALAHVVNAVVNATEGMDTSIDLTAGLAMELERTINEWFDTHHPEAV